MRRRATGPSSPIRLSSQADRKSTRLNSSHGYISYAVFCLKKKKSYEAHQAAAGGRTPNMWFAIAAYKIAAPLTGGNIGLQAGHGRPTNIMEFCSFYGINMQ